MINRRRVEQVARASGFRADSVEKVLRLRGILERLDRHPGTRQAWLLKGGTALNLLHLDVPRMSVDIDLDYIGAADREGMLAARPGFEAALVAVCLREGCDVRRVPDDHAGGKYRLRYMSVFGGSQGLEVDVSYVARVPLVGVVRLPTRFPKQDVIEVPTLTLVELAAGKFAALLHRRAVRDAFDAVNLLQSCPHLLDDPGFRLAFLCIMAGGRADPRCLAPHDPIPDVRAVEQQLLLVLHQPHHAGTSDADALCANIGRKLSGVAERLLAWSPAERRFLDRLHDEGELDAECLHADPPMRDRILIQPMLLWKARHVRGYRRRES